MLVIRCVAEGVVGSASSCGGYDAELSLVLALEAMPLHKPSAGPIVPVMCIYPLIRLPHQPP